MHFGVNLTSASFLPEFGKTLAFEAPDLSLHFGNSPEFLVKPSEQLRPQEGPEEFEVRRGKTHVVPPRPAWHMICRGHRAALADKYRRPAGSIKRLRLARTGSAILESCRAQCLAVPSRLGLSLGGGISDEAGAKLQQMNWRSPVSNS